MLKLPEGSPELSLTLNPSRYLLIYLISVHSLVSLSVVCYPLSATVRAVFFLLVLIHGIFYCYRVGFYGSPDRVTLLEIQRRGVWVGCHKDRLRVDIVSATVWKWITVINVRAQGGRSRSVVIFPDSCTVQERRRLRVLLRYCLVTETL